MLLDSQHMHHTYHAASSFTYSYAEAKTATDKGCLRQQEAGTVAHLESTSLWYVLQSYISKCSVLPGYVLVVTVIEGLCKLQVPLAELEDLPLS